MPTEKFNYSLADIYLSFADHEWDTLYHSRIDGLLFPHPDTYKAIHDFIVITHIFDQTKPLI